MALEKVLRLVRLRRVRSEGGGAGLPASGVGHLAQVGEAWQPDRRWLALLVVVECELDWQRLGAFDQDLEGDREPGAGPASEGRGGECGLMLDRRRPAAHRVPRLA